MRNFISEIEICELVVKNQNKQKSTFSQILRFSARNFLNLYFVSSLLVVTRHKLEPNLGTDMASKVEEKLQEAKVFKDAGNELYKSGNFKGAAKKYHRAILYLKGIDSDVHGGSPIPILKGLGHDAIDLSPELEQVISS